MPAVDMARLQKQISELTWKFTRPAEFHAAVVDLFELYANRVYRPGKATPAARLMTVYHAPPLVLRQLEQSLAPYCRENPMAALAVIDSLWDDENLEPRFLAGSLLGQLPIQSVEEVLARLQHWCTPEEEITAANHLLNRGASRLRREAPDQWITVIRTWAGNTSQAVQAVALRALLPFALDRDYENLPALFQTLRPILLASTPAIQGDLEDLLRALARRSPAETAFVLRQSLSMRISPSAARIIRRILPEFPAEMQIALRAALPRSVLSSGEG